MFRFCWEHHIERWDLFLERMPEHVWNGWERWMAKNPDHPVHRDRLAITLASMFGDTPNIAESTKNLMAARLYDPPQDEE